MDKIHERIIKEKIGSQENYVSMTLRGGKSYEGPRIEEKLNEIK